MSRGRAFNRGGGRGGGRGGFQHRDMGPPDQVLELGHFLHAVEDEMFCSSSIADKVPYFNASVYLQNKSEIGKVDEILGPINEVYFSVKMGGGMIATSFKKGDKVYIAGDKLLPIERFLPKPKIIGGIAKRSRGNRLAPGGRGASMARSFQRGGGRGVGRGGPRGSFGERSRGIVRGGLGRGRGNRGTGTSGWNSQGGRSGYRGS